MLKKAVFTLLLLFLTTWALSGCGGGGGGGNTPPNNGPIQEEIKQVLYDFAEAVGAYNVDGMLAPLDESDFKLTIKEGSIKYEKYYEKLEQELREDEQNQLAWRKSPDDDPNGHSYVLKLELSNFKFSNLNSSGGIVVCDFIVKESFNEKSEPIITDKGTITWGMVKKIGEWKMQTMINEFKPVTVNSLHIYNYQLSNRPKGFMFGKKAW